LKGVTILYQENIPSQKGTLLRKNSSQKLMIKINKSKLKDIYLINGNSFKVKGISYSDLLIAPDSYYMVINKGNKVLNLKYNQDISSHEVIYDPYKFELSKKVKLNPELLKKIYNIPEGYIGTLPKWYSFKFSYLEYNLIFVRPEFGLSIQTHKYRNEKWEILKGKPIIINNNKVHYFVDNNTIFNSPVNTYHSIINPNKGVDEFAIIKERWEGKFDENDIERVFNPNHYL